MALVDLSERPCSQGVLFVVPVGLDTDDFASHRRRLSKHGVVLKPTRGVASRRGAVTRSATIGLYPANKKTTASADYLSPMKVLPDMAINPLFNYTFQRDVWSTAHTNMCITLLDTYIDWYLLVETSIQYNTIPYNTIQYNAIQYNAMQCNTIQYNTRLMQKSQADTSRNWIRSRFGTTLINWIWFR